MVTVNIEPATCGNHSGDPMPDLLLEFLSEEIPARMQARAADDLKKMVTDALVAAGLVYEGASAYVTPRRLALSVHGLPAKQPDIKDERKGPKVGAPNQAIAGFLKAAGLTSINDAKIQKDEKKGDFYIAVIEKAGKATIDVVADIVPTVVRTFPWPKQMRWGSGPKVATTECSGRTHVIAPEPQRICFGHGKVRTTVGTMSATTSMVALPAFSITAM